MIQQVWEDAQLCISDKCPGDADATGPGTTYSVKALSWVILTTVWGQRHCSCYLTDARSKTSRGDKCCPKSLQLLPTEPVFKPRSVQYPAYVPIGFSVQPSVLGAQDGTFPLRCLQPHSFSVKGTCKFQTRAQPQNSTIVFSWKHGL